MSNNYHSDVYLRLLTLISLLTETEDGMTVNELSERLNVGKNTIINDLRNIQLEAEFNMSVGPADWDEEEYWGDKNAEVKEKEDNKFLVALYQGKHNDIPLRIVYLKKDEQFSVELTAFERVILSEFLKNHNMDNVLPVKKEIYIKHQSKPDFSIYEKLTKINDAIRADKFLQMRYVDKNTEGLKEIVIKPLKVVRLFLKGEYYVVAVHNNKSFICNVGNMKEIRETKQDVKIDMEVSERILEEYDYRWGVGKNEGIFDFELKIYNEVDLFQRLSKRLSSRKYGEWKEYGDYAIYTDKVIDYDALKQWVMSFGSSVKVIKPQKLADEIVKSAEERLEKYNALMARYEK